MTQVTDRRDRPLVLAALSALLAFPPGVRAGRPWNQVYSWAYQLQSPSVEAIARSSFDLVVIDYSRDGTHEGRFTRSDVERMRHGGGRTRLVVAYMSIGEAEPYRFYWRNDWRPGNPPWLLAPNPRWPDNYRVEFWDPDWQRHIFGNPDSYLDRIMDAGFDGVYLDIVDGYETFVHKRPRAKGEMVRFVRTIAHYARQVEGDPDFGIFPQNAPELLEDPTYLSVITGIGKEEVYFRATDSPTSKAERKWDEGLLDLAFRAGKLVLCVDYCKKRRNLREAYRRARMKGFIPYCTHVDLDRLTVHDEASLLGTDR